MSRTRVFVDTNILLEAFRTNCWTAICQHYAIETVEKCIEEALTGNSSDPRYIQVDRKTLVNGFAARHQVNKRDIAAFILSHPECQGIDDRELYLFAWLNAHGMLPNALILISTADKAAIVATGRLGWLDSVVSLEQLIQQSGVTRTQRNSIARHYRSDWLDEIKLKIRFGLI